MAYGCSPQRRRDRRGHAETLFSAPSLRPLRLCGESSLSLDNLDLLHRRRMTSRRLLLTYVLGVAIRAVARFLELCQLVFDRSDLRIRRLLVVFVTCRACGHRNVGRESAERTSPRDVDVTGRALLHMVFLATFVTEHR